MKRDPSANGAPLPGTEELRAGNLPIPKRKSQKKRRKQRRQRGGR